MPGSTEAVLVLAQQAFRTALPVSARKLVPKQPSHSWLLSLTSSMKTALTHAGSLLLRSSEAVPRWCPLVSNLHPASSTNLSQCCYELRERTKRTGFLESPSQSGLAANRVREHFAFSVLALVR